MKTLLVNEAIIKNRDVTVRSSTPKFAGSMRVRAALPALRTSELDGIGGTWLLARRSVSVGVGSVEEGTVT